MLFIDSEYRGEGYGKRMMEHWEQDMQSIGYGMIMIKELTV
ncbi:MAG: GNAT family N-acetyltransferase [Lachnospiraceae bacterium]|nr:GNAT family N-acetyltransferase [Lachnospiraceae bacterium]